MIMFRENVFQVLLPTSALHILDFSSSTNSYIGSGSNSKEIKLVKVLLLDVVSSRGKVIIKIACQTHPCAPSIFNPSMTPGLGQKSLSLPSRSYNTLPGSLPEKVLK